GLRVAFEPRAACAHDHALDVESFARRRRVIGWSAHAIQRRTPDAGLFQVASWEGLEREVAAEASERERLLRAVLDLCARERAGSVAPGATRDALGWIQRLGELEFRLGLVLGHRGELPAPPPRALEDLPAPLPRAADRVPAPFGALARNDAEAHRGSRSAPPAARAPGGVPR